jgi:hypothetical protein
MEPSWLITPLVCVSEYLGEPCEMPIKIVFNKLPNDNYCLYQDEFLLHCLQGNNTNLNIQLNYDHAVWLVLKDAAGNSILKQELSIKAQQSNNKRRRIRSPWSLF